MSLSLVCIVTKINKYLPFILGVLIIESNLFKMNFLVHFKFSNVYKDQLIGLIGNVWTL